MIVMFPLETLLLKFHSNMLKMENSSGYDPLDQPSIKLTSQYLQKLAPKYQLDVENDNWPKSLLVLELGA